MQIFAWLEKTLLPASVPFILASVVLYAAFLFMLVKYRKHESFNHPFYHLMISLGVADLLMVMPLQLQKLTFSAKWLAFLVITTISGKRFTIIHRLPQAHAALLYIGDNVVRIVYTGRFGAGVVQFTHVSIMAAMRFTGVFMPAKHNIVSNTLLACKIESPVDITFNSISFGCPSVCTS